MLFSRISDFEMFKHIVLLGINKYGGCDVSLRHKRSGGLHINNRGIPIGKYPEKADTTYLLSQS